MNLNLAYDLLVAMLLVFTRLSVFFTLAPPFAGRNFNARARAAMSFAIALAVAPVVRPTVTAQTWNSLTNFATAIGFQVLVGATLGLSVIILFTAFQTAGQYVDMTGGFAMASMFDPTSGTNSSIIGRYTGLLATALLFTSGGHLIMIRGVLESFDIQVTKAIDTGAIAQALIHDFGIMITSALQIAAPVLAVLFLADLALGLVSRAVPSMNVFQLSFPIKLILTLTLASVFILVFPEAVTRTIADAVARFPAMTDMLGGKS
ncbi:flagellar biosynthetic protein FliR [Dermatophilus congolensis]|uniref:flagellar biosynthetic protein FliR n=1 Tax=Dermatophilus congolensis TaxID=1863 RepID=UPI001AAFCEB7|nr:flagellar biosynthetic protein FliR [Dermatophilus congolensis]MBO3183973.1 flagellar biosynthetic protein FliR [Dermatophilus congolensis]MBO3206484.1 flagellar biosynthetic protein FliR [Dermatophilus congolensis]